MELHQTPHCPGWWVRLDTAEFKLCKSLVDYLKYESLRNWEVLLANCESDVISQSLCSVSVGNPCMLLFHRGHFTVKQAVRPPLAWTPHHTVHGSHRQKCIHVCLQKTSTEAICVSQWVRKHTLQDILTHMEQVLISKEHLTHQVLNRSCLHSVHQD